MGVILQLPHHTLLLFLVGDETKKGLVGGSFVKGKLPGLPSKHQLPHEDDCHAWEDILNVQCPLSIFTTMCDSLMQEERKCLLIIYD